MHVVFSVEHFYIDANTHRNVVDALVASANIMGDDVGMSFLNAHFKASNMAISAQPTTMAI